MQNSQVLPEVKKNSLPKLINKKRTGIIPYLQSLQSRYFHFWVPKVFVKVLLKNLLFSLGGNWSYSSNNIYLKILCLIWFWRISVWIFSVFSVYKFLFLFPLRIRSVFIKFSITAAWKIKYMSSIKLRLLILAADICWCSNYKNTLKIFAISGVLINIKN